MPKHPAARRSIETKRSTEGKHAVEPKREAERPRVAAPKRQTEGKADVHAKRTAEAKDHARARRPAESKTPEEPKRDGARRQAVEPKRREETKRQAEPSRRAPEAKRPARKTVEPVEKAPAPQSGFSSLGLSDDTLRLLAKIGYAEPSPIQAGLIPVALRGVDVMGQAQTGTGKTAAFALPILEQMDPEEKRGPQALVLVPTRELAVQVYDETVKLTADKHTKIAAVYGGKPLRKQAEQIRDGADFVVGTPGRVIDLIGRGALFLGDLRFVVLDEADRMLDIGFRPDIEKILRKCPQARQTLLLSATIAPPVKRLAERYMREPEMIDCSPKNVAADTIEQAYFSVLKERKLELLYYLLAREKPRQAIIFCRTKRGTDKLHRLLSAKIQGVDTIHGDLQQSARDRVMRKFRDGKIRFLVATDVVGRGIDVSGVSHIINYDVPEFCDDYIHRVGRTGRMGREGEAFTFVTPEEGDQLTRIEMRIDKLLKRDEIAGFPALELPESKRHAHADGAAPATPAEPEPPKPVFGRRTKRYRRAL